MVNEKTYRVASRAYDAIIDEGRQHGEALDAALEAAMSEQPPTLPYDVKIGPITYRRGCELETFVEAARRWYNMAAGLDDGDHHRTARV